MRNRVVFPFALAWGLAGVLAIGGVGSVLFFSAAERSQDHRPFREDQAEFPLLLDIDIEAR